MTMTDIEQNLVSNPAQEALNLRKRLLDLQKTGMLGPQGFPTYQQTILQIWQEAERRRNSLLVQAQDLRAKAMQAEAQSHAFSVIGSILYAVINGYVEAENKRLLEEQQRAQERAEADAEAAAASESKAGKRKKRDIGDQ